MPKPLREPPPSSSVMRFFDMGAAARAVAVNAPPLATNSDRAPDNTVAPVAPTATNAPVPSQREVVLAPVVQGDHPNVKRELVLTARTDETFTRFVDLYRKSTGTRLTSSHVARALLKALDYCMDTLEREARRIGPLKLPSNARGRELERERFEARIADAIVSGIRAAAAFDPDK